MSRYEDGEYMDLVWDGTPDAYYIKGHVTNEDGLAILGDWGIVEPSIGQAQQIYGRWSMDGDNDGCQTLRDYNRPGRGRFKITVFATGIFTKQSEDKGNG